MRHRLRCRQVDLARRASVSHGVISLIERGRLERVTLARIRRVARELDAEFTSQLWWRGGDLDRLVDEGHAALVGRVVKLLQAAGWLVRVEVSYNVYGERGSIDVLAWHAPSRALLVVEVKTEVVALEATLRKHDEKVRLGPRLASEQFGWQPIVTGRLLVLPSLSTARRRIERHDNVMAAMYPLRGDDLRAWLAQPWLNGGNRVPGGKSITGGVLFVDPTVGGVRRASPISRKRIRTPSSDRDRAD